MTVFVFHSSITHEVDYVMGVLGSSNYCFSSYDYWRVWEYYVLIIWVSLRFDIDDFVVISMPW